MKTDWIPVSEKLPNIGYKNQVLVYCKREYENEMEIIQAWREDYGFCSLFMREDEDLHVTHWMYLPKPPTHIF